MKRTPKVIFTLILLMTIVILAFVYASPKVKNIYTDWAKDRLGNQEDMYSVIVVGSDPEGIAAAIASARSGARTLLLGKEDGPGGLLTYGMLNTLDMNRNDKGELLTRGIFNEFYSRIGNTESFDVKKAKQVFLDLISQEENLTYLPNYKFSASIIEGNVIKGVEMLNTKGQKETFLSKRVIDATQDGDVAAASGVPYYVGMEDVNWDENMAATLIFKVGEVDWKQLAIDVKNYQKETNDMNSGVNRSTAWAFGKWCYDKYTPVYKNMKLRGLNIGLQDDGTVLVNALQIFNVDGLNQESRKKALKEGTEEIENIVGYLRKLLPSFKNAYVAGVADDLYIRETRHIQGEYVLKATDILKNVNFKDKIALGSYPIDIQSTNIKNTGYVVGAPKQYSIPLRCIIPLNVENMFIVGRSASYSSIAAGSARVVPIGMATGESSGIAAVYSIVEKVTPRELTKSQIKVNELTKILKGQGAYLPEFYLSDPNEDVIGYSQIRKIIDLGFLSGGYQNDFGFEKEATIGNFSMALVNGLQRGGKEKYNLEAVAKITSYSNEKITAVKAAEIVAAFLGENLQGAVESPVINSNMTEEEIKAEKERVNELREQFIWNLAQEKKYFVNMEEKITKKQVLNRRQAYLLAVNTLEKYLGRELY